MSCQPGDDVPAAVAAGDPRRVADGEVHLAAGQVQVLGDLRAGLAGAHDQHLARAGSCVGVAVCGECSWTTPLGQRRSAHGGTTGRW